MESASNGLMGKRELLLLNYLQKNGEKSRVDIAKGLHLTKAAVTALTNAMVLSCKIIEKGEQTEKTATHSRGRRKILLDINENYKLVFGVAIEKNIVMVGLTNLKGQILDRGSRRFDGKNYRELLEIIVLSIQTILKNNCMTSEHILALGISISHDCGAIVEGIKLTDKLMRIKKDLAHAITMRMVTGTTIGGGVLAQQLFCKEETKNALLLRYNSTADTAMIINGTLYEGQNGLAGGFLIFPDLCTISDGEVQQTLAQSISLCAKVIDVEKIYSFGEYLESEENFTAVNELIHKNYNANAHLIRAVITDKTAFLAPCAQAIDSYFLCNKKV